jgi:hypothetical protein
MSRADECIAAIKLAAKEKLTDDEVGQVFERANEIEKRLRAEGSLDNLNDRLRDLTQQDADRTVIAAALQRKQVAINAVVRDRLTAHLDGMVAAGMSPRSALLAVMEGSQQGIAGARQSVYATRQAFESRYRGGVMAQIAKDRPHIMEMIDDEAFNADVVREMFELRKGGAPGRTGNADAQFMAKTFATYAEMSRTDVNRLGANVGKLDGWAGPQIHDDAKIRNVERDVWRDTIRPLLNFDRTFPEARSAAEVDHILDDIHTTIVTGREANAPARDSVVGPASLATSLGKSRVLHFRDADAWLSYRDQFGGAPLFAAMDSHLQRAASSAAQMTVFGTNPENMMKTVVDRMLDRVRDDPKMSAADKAKAIEALQFNGPGLGNGLGNAFAEMQGFTMSPVNTKAAQINQTIRNIEGMAKLGGAVISSVIPDTTTAALASFFRGGGFLRGFVNQMEGLIQGRPKGEQAEVSFLLGEGFDGLLGHIHTPYLAQDGVPGGLHKLATSFYRMQGLTWWTDVSRSAAGRTIAAEMGMRAGSTFDALPARYRHVLELNGITGQKWEAVRSMTRTLDNGRAYITPDLMRGVRDELLDPMIAGRMDDARVKIKDPVKLEAARQRYLADARLELELDVGRFVADETSYGVLEGDAKSRRMLLQGSRPGTATGEVLRYIAQFKGFTTAAADRLVGRAVFGGEGGTKGERFVNNIGHSGRLIAFLGLAGYMTMAAKDALKGRWPPRDPAEAKTWSAALAQGGGAGIYGDFLFGEANRFGNSPLENVAGPVPAAAANVISLYQRVRAGEAKAADGLNLALNNTPFINLWFARPALDVLVLNSVREWSSPGFLARQRQRLRKDFNQESFFPKRLSDLQ